MLIEVIVYHITQICSTTSWRLVSHLLDTDHLTDTLEFRHDTENVSVDGHVECLQVCGISRRNSRGYHRLD